MPQPHYGHPLERLVDPIQHPIHRMNIISGYVQARQLVCREVEAAEPKIQEAMHAGDARVAQSWCDSLEIRADELDKLRRGLSRLDNFVIKYNVQAFGDSGVSLVLPAGRPHIEVMAHVDALIQGHTGKKYFPPDENRWITDRWVDRKRSTPQTISIEALAPDTLNKTREKQERVLESQGKHMALAEDVAIAHAAFFLLTGEDLFRGQTVRAEGGVFQATDTGRFGQIFYHDNAHYPNLWAAARVTIEADKNRQEARI